MIDNYRTNENFFICITAGDFMWPEYVFEWFFQNTSARFRLIIDKELDEQAANLKMVNEIYPGVETIAVVSNPWIKTVNGFNKLTSLKSKGIRHPIVELFEIDLSSFNNYVNQLTEFKNIPQLWFTPATTALEWTTYVNELGEIQKPKFTIRKEYILEDFKSIQEFFCTEQPLVLPEGICPQTVEHRKFYNDTTKKIINEIYCKDIEEYGFEF
jgi:hypothetical protein